MRPYKRFNFLLWGLGFFLLALHLGYLLHFGNLDSVWRVIRFMTHPLGILGTLFMALSLLYVLSKKKTLKWGKIKFWYKFHVFMGLIGPVLIFIHAHGKYYGLGGLCLLFVWLVMATGIIGHFLQKKLPGELELRLEGQKTKKEKLEQLAKQADDIFVKEENLRLALRQTDSSAYDPQKKTFKLPRPNLYKNPKAVFKVLEKYLLSGKKLAQSQKNLLLINQEKFENQAEKTKTLNDLFRLQRDMEDLVLLNELYSLWRKIHGPLGWFLWFLVACHVFAWAWY